VKASKNWVWQPPTETIETIASVLRAHWAAAKSQQLSVFWPVQAARPVQAASPKAASWRTQLTNARAAADSSDTLPGLHPC